MVDDFKGRGGSPWGSPPGGGGDNGSGRGPRPPDIEEIIKKIQSTINIFMPGNGASSGRPLIFGLIILNIQKKNKLIKITITENKSTYVLIRELISIMS